MALLMLGQSHPNPSRSLTMVAKLALRSRKIHLSQRLRRLQHLHLSDHQVSSVETPSQFNVTLYQDSVFRYVLAGGTYLLLELGNRISRGLDSRSKQAKHEMPPSLWRSFWIIPLCWSCVRVRPSARRSASQCRMIWCRGTMINSLSVLSTRLTPASLSPMSTVTSG